MRPAAVLTLCLALPPLAAAQDKGTEVKLNKLKGTTPADWVKEKPANLLRSYQFKLPGAKGAADAEVAVFPESHPNPDKSLPRWKAQFVPPEGKTVDDIGRLAKWEVKGAAVTVFDVTGGTWKYKERPQDPASKEQLMDNYRVVWVIVAEEDEATHVRLSGPVASVEKHFKAFEGWVKGFR
ncbi:MAG: hypothetical protein C0501_26900 [Isosphaera sp.]|nr:hypothetical protein [Isosphaera sp.]